MPTPAPGASITHTNIATEFVALVPGFPGVSTPMDLKFRFPGPNYTPNPPTIPTATGTGILPMDGYHGKTYVAPGPPPFFTPFTTPGSWTSPFTGNITLLIIGGGGAGGALGPVAGPAGRAGGGGAGAYIYYNMSYPVVSGRTYPFTIGAGGINSNGGNTVWNNPGSAPLTRTALGGGKGGDTSGPGLNGSPGGCGGGAGPVPAAIGTGTGGFPGGIVPTPSARSGGGGGTGGVGGNPPTTNPGPLQGFGGAGTNITFTPGPTISFGGGGSAGGYGGRLGTAAQGGGIPGSVNGTAVGAGGAGRSPGNAQGQGAQGAIYISYP